jgi:hypothetical protein
MSNATPRCALAVNILGLSVKVTQSIDHVIKTDHATGARPQCRHRFDGAAYGGPGGQYGPRFAARQAQVSHHIARALETLIRLRDPSKLIGRRFHHRRLHNFLRVTRNFGNSRVRLLLGAATAIGTMDRRRTNGQAQASQRPDARPCRARSSCAPACSAPANDARPHRERVGAAIGRRICLIIGP